MDRRSFIIGSAATAATLNASFAQDAYPARAITVINPFPPGGAADVVIRPLAAVLEPMVQKPVVIDTKAGAAGQVGAQVAAHAKPDGYTLLAHITSISGFAEVDRLFGRAPKFTNADFIPLARFVADPCVLIVNDQQPYKTLQEFIDDARKRPNEIIFSSSGLYGALHIPTALFAAAAGGLKLRHLPTQGVQPIGYGSSSSATTHRCWCRRSRPVCPRSRLARRSRWPCSAASARRRCPTCRP